MKFISIIFLIFLIFLPSAIAETFYACSTGDGSAPHTAACAGAWNESNVGNSSNWDSDVADDDKFGPGDIMYLMDDGGEYNGTFVLYYSGTSDNHISIINYPGDSPEINGTASALTIGGKSYIDIIGITFRDSSVGNVGIRTDAADASYITFTDCIFDNAGANGIRIWSHTDDEAYAAHHITLRDNEYTNNGDNGVSIGGTWDVNNILITGGLASGNNTLEQDRQGVTAHLDGKSDFTTGWDQHLSTNVYYRDETTGSIKGAVTAVYHKDDDIELAEEDGQTTSVGANKWDYNAGTLYVNVGSDANAENILVFYGIISDVIVEYMNVTTTIEDISNGADGSGIVYDYGVEDSIIRYNNIYENEGHGVALIYSKNIEVYGNVIYDNGQGTGSDMGVRVHRNSTAVVADNTIVNNAEYGVTAETFGTVTVQGNIIKDHGLYGVADDGDGVLTENYNLFNGNASERLSVTDNGTSKSKDPLFTNEGSDDYTLKQNSPAKHGDSFLDGYETKLSPKTSWPDDIYLMEDILSIGAYGTYKGAVLK